MDKCINWNDYPNVNHGSSSNASSIPCDIPAITGKGRTNKLINLEWKTNLIK